MIDEKHYFHAAKLSSGGFLNSLKVGQSFQISIDKTYNIDIIITINYTGY